MIQIKNRINTIQRLMRLYQEEEIGLFTFYKQQEEQEDRLNPFNVKRQQRAFVPHDANKPIDSLRKKGKMFTSQLPFTPNTTISTKKVSKLNCLFGKVDKQKNKIGLGINRLKFQIDKSESKSQNSQKLKSYLQRLLTNQQVLNPDKKQKKMEEKRFTLPQKQHYQIENANKNLTISTINYNLGEQITAKQNQIFPNVICSTNLPSLAKLDPFPRRLQKKSQSQKLKTINQMRKRKLNLLVFPKSQSADHKGQYYLQPLKSERNHSNNTYTMKIQYFNLKGQQRSQTQQPHVNLSDKIKNKLFLQLARTIKFQ